ncbi:SpoIIE family protein phosphatase [Paenibacillus agilis]|uniref:Fused response regulator/phosphatase n=1 Tax=Paenibacillus agilis TaxID=3020863 RepID=A0A559IGH9_9BACL|nr:fused response regulator/phosphatase [Paenibacillus agilis]TVX86758.1 fused response regulator/phosphatase [Paenibacillus agilis]
MNILVVDDNPTNVMLIREILRKDGYQRISTASCAQEMYQHLGLDYSGKSEDAHPKEPDVDLILLDMMMPEIDGLQACRHIQQLNHLRDIPIIMVTAVADSNILADALDAGAVDYVTKPVNRIELLARIRLALRLKQEKDWHKERDYHIRQELRLAAKVQESVLTEPYEDQAITIKAIYRPSEELAGDLYAWFPLSNGKYGVLILDMMGHGVSSALLCMYIASALRTTVKSEAAPDIVLQQLNAKFDQLYMNDSLTLYYMTAIYVIVDTKNDVIRYANAGHPPGIVVMENGEVIQMETTGHPVGMFPELHIDVKEISCTHRFRVGLYTDGLVESSVQSLDMAIADLTELVKTETDIDDSLSWQQLFENESLHEDDKCLVWVDVHHRQGV